MPIYMLTIYTTSNGNIIAYDNRVVFSYITLILPMQYATHTEYRFLFMIYIIYYMLTYIIYTDGGEVSMYSYYLQLLIYEFL